MVKPGGRRASAGGRGGGAGGGVSSGGTEKDAAGIATRKMRLRRRPALGDISSAVSNKAGASANATGARKTRKRKASGSSCTASTQDPPQRPTGQRRAGSSSTAAAAAVAAAAATAAAVVSEAEEDDEEEEDQIEQEKEIPDATTTRRRPASAATAAAASTRPRRASRGAAAAAAAVSASDSSGSGKKVARKGSSSSSRQAQAAAAAAARQELLRRCNVPPSPVSEHDVEDRDDPVACAEYVADMYKRFKELEEKYTPTVYMHTQMDINCKMRAILIDWIVEVHLKFKLADPTLYLTCHIIDRFCMQENVHRSKLQLVGVTALLIACKYEEIFPTEVRDCVYITDHAYTRDEVLEMEQTILRRLKFELTVPTPWTFLVRFLKVAKATDRQHHRAQYYLERCLQEHDGLSFRPSMLAAASLYLARIPDSGVGDAWPASLAKFCNVPQEGLECCARMIIKFLLDEPVTASQRHLVAVKKKFLGERFLAVAIDDLPELPPKPHIAGN